MPITPNPLSALWTNRPEPIIVPAYAHPEEYAGQSSMAKRTAIAKSLKSEKLEAIFLNAVLYLFRIQNNGTLQFLVFLLFRL